MNFQIIPAIDLRGGKCVRLFQGDFSKETVYGDDPIQMARIWQDEGASIIHIVELDGARTGFQKNLKEIQAIVTAIDVPVQVGGGIRSLDNINRLLEAGVERTVIGTAAVENEAFVAEALRIHPDAIVIGIDAREGLIATKGWEQQESVSTNEIIQRMSNLGARHYVHTDISRDGALTGPNVEAIKDVITAAAPASVIASGGVASIDDIKALARTGALGVIVGKALYNHSFSLNQALAAMSQS